MNTDFSKKRKLILSCINSALVAILFSFTVVSFVYSWYVNVKRTGGVEITTASSTLVNMEMYTYVTNTDNTMKWKKTSIAGRSSVLVEDNIPKDGLQLPIISASYTLSDLHFGTIDNLVDLKQSNYLYFRFILPTESCGKTFKCKTAIDSTTPFNLYYNNAKIENTDSQWTSIKSIVDANKILDFSYYITSDSTYIPSSDTFNRNDFTAFSGDLNTYSFKNTYTGDAENYYVIIQMKPELAPFAPISKVLYNRMPCLLLWNYSMEIEVLEESGE